MKLLKNLYAFSAKERRGLLVLFGLILSLQALLFGMNYWHPKSVGISIDTPEIKAYQTVIDSLKQLKIANSKPKIYPFNPNFITDYKAYTLGMSTEAFDRLQAFRKQDLYVNSAQEFQKVTGISDSLLGEIQPYFKFPDWVKNQKKYTTQVFSEITFTSNLKQNPNQNPKVKSDLNTATHEQLIAIYGIGEKLADRIIGYRTKLQGFSVDAQLYEVYYLDRETADKVLQQFTVLSKPQIIPINVNTATFKEVLHSSPYMTYEITKGIFNYKNAAGKILSLEVLKKIEGFPLDKFDRISLYLKAE